MDLLRALASDAARGTIDILPPPFGETLRAIRRRSNRRSFPPLASDGETETSYWAGEYKLLIPCRDLFPLDGNRLILEILAS